MKHKFIRLSQHHVAALPDINGLKNEIASTQRLVLKSAKSVRRFARELGVHHPV